MLAMYRVPSWFLAACRLGEMGEGVQGTGGRLCLWACVGWSATASSGGCCTARGAHALAVMTTALAAGLFTEKSRATARVPAETLNRDADLVPRAHAGEAPPTWAASFKVQPLDIFCVLWYNIGREIDLPPHFGDSKEVPK